MEQKNNIANKNEPFRNYNEVEKYLQNKQVYLRKDIVNSDFKRMLKGRMVYNIEYVEIKSLNKRPIETFAFTLIIEGLEFTIYEYKTQQELFKWIKQNFIPISELIYNRQNYKDFFISGFMLGNGSYQLKKEVDIDLEFEKFYNKL
jgi:hypothetical protein